jgi:hypothetical protein
MVLQELKSKSISKPPISMIMAEVTESGVFLYGTQNLQNQLIGQWCGA